MANGVVLKGGLRQLVDDVEVRMARRSDLCERMAPHVRGLLTEGTGDSAAKRQRDADLALGAAEALDLGWTIAELVRGLGYEGDVAAKVRPKLARHWLVGKAIRDKVLDGVNARGLIQEDGLTVALKQIRAATDKTTGVERAADALKAAANALEALVRGKEKADGTELFTRGNVLHALSLLDNQGIRATLGYVVEKVAEMLVEGESGESDAK